MDAFRFNDELTCLPQNISSLVVYYNKDMFEKAGVAEPKAGWKWADMVAAAKKLTKDRTATARPRSTVSASKPAIIRLAPFIWSAGGELVDDDENPTHFTFDTPEAQNALSGLLRAARRRRGHPERGGGRVRGRRDALPERPPGECSWRRGASTPTLPRRNQGLRLGRRRASAAREQAGILHSDAYCMTKASENKDAAWSFMEYALGPEGRRDRGQVRSDGPVAEVGRRVADAFLDPTAKPANSQVFLDTIPVDQAGAERSRPGPRSRMPWSRCWRRPTTPAKGSEGLVQRDPAGEGSALREGQRRGRRGLIDGGSVIGRTEVRGRPEGLRARPGAPRPRPRGGRRRSCSSSSAPPPPARARALRVAAGLEEATEGSIHIGGRDVTRVAPAQRNMSMVFQNYALFPHLTVGENIGFGLRARGVLASRDAGTVNVGGRARSAAATCWSESPSSSRAASGSALPWLVRSCGSRMSSCSTSRCRISTLSCGCSCEPS